MTPAKSENANRTENRDHRREVTDSIIKMLEDGVAPWQKPWEGAAMPFNPTTERAYRGGNAVHLLATGIGREYADPRWMTYKQAADQGWQVRKGEKGTHIEFWEVKGRSNEKDSALDQSGAESPADENARRLIHRIYTVFNGKQIDGIPEYQPKNRTPLRPSKLVSEFSQIPALESNTISSKTPFTTDSPTASNSRRKKRSKTPPDIAGRPFMSLPTGPAILPA